MDHQPRIREHTKWSMPLTRRIRLGAAALAAALVALPFGSPAHAAEIIGIVADIHYSYDPADPAAGAKVVYSGLPDGADLTLPETVTFSGVEYPVSEIGEEVFSYRKLNSASIPGSVKKIGQEAFLSSGLTQLTLGDGVELIGYLAFSENKFDSVVLPGSVHTVEGVAFSWGELKSVVFSEGLTTIMEGAFQLNQLTEVELPSTLTTLGGGAFWANELTSFTLPPSISVLEYSVFADNNLASITVPGTVKTIEWHAFKSNPATDVVIEEGVEVIGQLAFAGTDVTAVSIASTVHTIHAAAFETYGENWGDPPTPKTVRFAGDAPTLFSYGGLNYPNNPPFGPYEYADLVFNCGASGFTTPTWEGYPTSAECTIAFDTGGGSPVEDQVTAHGDNISEPAPPTRDGYIFAGWHTGSSDGPVWDFSTPVTDSFTLFAAWEAIAPEQHTITFDAQGGTLVPAMAVEHGSVPTMPAAPARDGFEFTGWFTNQEATDPFDSSAPVLQSYTLYAGWKTVAVTPNPDPTPGGTGTPAPGNPSPGGSIASTGSTGAAWPLALGTGALLLGAAVTLRRRQHQ